MLTDEAFEAILHVGPPRGAVHAFGSRQEIDRNSRARELLDIAARDSRGI